MLRALVILGACAGAALGKGSSGSSSSGGYSSGSSFSTGGASSGSASYSSSYSSGKMGGSSWSGSGSGRTSGGSRIYRHDDDDFYYSSGPRTYYGGTGHRGPRYYNNRAVTYSGFVVAAAWLSSGHGRYNFYDREARCTKTGYFRFGYYCKKCSTAVCPDGQYRVQCGGGSDGYCTACDNGCGLFNTDQAASADSEPRFGVCLLEGRACFPYQNPFECAYTSEGEPGKAVSNCQIESCCYSCKSDDEAKAQGKGTVCRGATAGLENKNDKAVLRFDVEVPLTASEFNAKGSEYKAAIQSVAGGAQVRPAWVIDRDPVDVITYRRASSSASANQTAVFQPKSCLVAFEVYTTAR